MNKKNKNGLKWVLLIIVLIITAFTVSMVACGLFKEKSGEKAAEENSGESEESMYDTSAFPDTGNEQISLDGIISDEATIEFDLSALPDTIEPCGICYADGCLYITDSYAKSVWKISEDTTEVFAGADSSRDIYDKPQGGYNDAPANEALFKLPWSVAPFLNGIAVTDTENNAIRLINDNRVDTVNSVNGTDEYNYPTGIASDGAGNLFVADTHSDSIKAVSEDGTVSTLLDGLDSPMGLSYNSGFLYIAETGKNRIIRISTEDVSSKKSSADVELVAGSGEEGFSDGVYTDATFSSPKGLTVTTDGSVFVADTVNGAVRLVKDGQVSTLEIRDTRIPEAELVSPIGICIQGRRLYICDNFGMKIYTADF